MSAMVYWYRVVVNALMVVMGTVVLIRAVPLGAGLLALLVGGGLIGLGSYRVSALVRARRGRVA